MNANTSVNLSPDSLMPSSDLSAAAGETLSDSRASLTVSDQSQNTGFGTLIAQVSAANGSIPIMGASVIISNTDGSIIETQSTDNSGRTPGLRLSAPSSELSQTPNGERPYSTYNIRVEHPGYYTKEFLNTAVFDKIVSIQPVTLEPLGEDATENDRSIVIDEAANS